jgi:large subunit ribosomal protein L25
MELVLECTTRPDGSKPNALRRSGQIPAVLYGHKGAESTELTVEAKAVERLLKKASVNNTLIDLQVSDGEGSGKALLREVQTHPWKGYVYHLSFFSIANQQSLDISVPVRLVDEAECPGLKVGSGSIDQSMAKLKVRCAAGVIPDHIDVSLAGVEVGQMKHVSDLTMPDGVEALDKPDNVIVTILAPR